MQQHHRWTVKEYERLIEYHILKENDRVELIRGEIYVDFPTSDRHVDCVTRLNRLFNRRVGDTAIVNIQNPILLADSAPEPDVSLLRPQEDFYESGKPRPPAVLLVIEVADSTLDYDREVKRPLYAENGIVEYWILNLAEACLEVYREPQADGSYRDVRTLRRGEQADVVALPGLTVAVAEIL